MRRSGRTSSASRATEPGVADVFVRRAFRQVAYEKPVDVLRQQDADDDGELIDGNQLPANLGQRATSAMLSARDSTRVDGHAAENAPEDEDGEVVRQRIAH